MTEHTPDPNSTEPLLNVDSLTALASAVLSGLIAFGVRIDATQRAALVGLVAAAAPLAVWLWGRRRVYSPATVHKLLAACQPRTELRGEHGPETLLPGGIGSPGARVVRLGPGEELRPRDGGAIL